MIIWDRLKLQDGSGSIELKPSSSSITYKTNQWAYLDSNLAFAGKLAAPTGQTIQMYSPTRFADDVTFDEGSTLTLDGNLTFMSGDLIHHEGNIVVEQGNVTVSSGNIACSNGNITTQTLTVTNSASIDNITATTATVTGLTTLDDLRVTGSLDLPTAIVTTQYHLSWSFVQGYMTITDDAFDHLSPATETLTVKVIRTLNKYDLYIQTSQIPWQHTDVWWVAKCNAALKNIIQDHTIMTNEAWECYRSIAENVYHPTLEGFASHWVTCIYQKGSDYYLCLGLDSVSSGAGNYYIKGAAHMLFI